MRFLCFILISALLSFSANAEMSDFWEFKYQVVKGDSFSRILRKFVKDDTILDGKSRTVRESIKANPHMNTKEVWLSPPVGSYIDLKIEKSILDSEKVKAYQASLAKKHNTVEVSDDKKAWRASLFYMASMGSFEQNSSTLPSVNYQQNSFLSLGTSLSYTPQASLWSYSASVYLSSLKATGSNLNNDKVTIPNEMGANFYAERLLTSYGLTAYGGFDYDSFSTFNLEGIRNDEKIYVDENKIYYLTLGMAKKVSIAGHPYFFKLALSKSLMSSFTSNYVSTTNEKLSGYRAMVYLNTKISDNFYFHTLFKYHSMSSSFDLNVMRIGVGIGYILF